MDSPFSPEVKSELQNDILSILSQQFTCQDQLDTLSILSNSSDLSQDSALELSDTNLDAALGLRAESEASNASSGKSMPASPSTSMAFPAPPSVAAEAAGRKLAGRTRRSTRLSVSSSDTVSTAGDESDTSTAAHPTRHTRKRTDSACFDAPASRKTSRDEATDSSDDSSHAAFKCKSNTKAAISSKLYRDKKKSEENALKIQILQLQEMVKERDRVNFELTEMLKLRQAQDMSVWPSGLALPAASVLLPFATSAPAAAFDATSFGAESSLPMKRG